jgi:flavin reductase (DIM6/NTAB) family NADH-FMN oxidoreductase RutF
LIEKSAAFGVTILGSHQKEISDIFAGGHSENLDRFDGLEVQTLETGAPFLKNNLACFDCKVVYTLPVSTQTVVVGEVVALENNIGDEPLLYFDQAYRKLQG